MAMKTRIEISVRQAGNANEAICDNWHVRNELVAVASNVYEWYHDLDLEVAEDREAHDNFIEEVKMVLDLAGITEYEITEVDD